jgi:hypothetical protein
MFNKNMTSPKSAYGMSTACFNGNGGWNGGVKSEAGFDNAHARKAKLIFADRAEFLARPLTLASNGSIVCVAGPAFFAIRQLHLECDHAFFWWAMTIARPYSVGCVVLRGPKLNQYGQWDQTHHARRLFV